MSFKTILRYLNEAYPKFTCLYVSRNLCRSNGAVLLRRRISDHYELNEQPRETSGIISFEFLCYRLFSTANENPLVRDQSNNVINVQPVEFEDISFEKPVSHDDLLKALQDCKSVEEQMKALCTTLSLSKEDIKKRIYFCKTIELFLKPFFYDIKIQMFGSTVNRFGFKGCDIDMSFETSVKPNEEALYFDRPDVPLVSEVLTGKVTPLEISQLPAKEQLLFIHSVLMEYYKETEEPIIFINAYIPLVRFYHDKYNLKCDLSCGNRVAFANTKLLYLFAKLDDRVVPLMMTIRYWAKHVELIGKGLVFNTYTISLLVIFFLQTRSPPIIPSAQYILSISDKLNVGDMNDETFLSITEDIPSSQNTQSLGELLREFFFFYLYFDFTRVICPLIAASVPRDDFFSSASRKFRMNTICVQDPMLLSHNVAELVDFKTCKSFVKEIMAVCKIFQDSTHINPTVKGWGLMSLLDKPEKYSLHYVTSEKLVSFTLPLVSTSNDDLKSARKKLLLTAETVLHILQDVLLFECKVLGLKEIYGILQKHDEIMEKKKKISDALIQSKNEINEMLEESKRKYAKKMLNILNKSEFPISTALLEFKKMNEENELILSAKCIAFKNTWLGRDFVELKGFTGSNSLLNKEHFISTNAAKQNELNSLESKTKPFSFLFECYASPNVSSESMYINFRPLERIFFNPILGIFLRDYIPKLIQRINNS